MNAFHTAQSSARRVGPSTCNSKNAVETASRKLRELRIAEVVKFDIKIEKGKVLTYRTLLRLSFKYEH